MSPELERVLKSRSTEDRLDHSVWDEPGLSRELSGEIPQGELTYASWLDERRAATQPAFTWLVVLGLAVATGPWSVIATFAAEFAGEIPLIGRLFSPILVAPPIEEFMKIMLALLIIEKRPFWFLNGFQVLLCAAGGGAAFGAIENLLYIYVYVSDAPPGFAQYRWMVCTTMHITCSTIAGFGLWRMHHAAMTERVRPNVANLYPFLIAAMILHALYNTYAMLSELAERVF